MKFLKYRTSWAWGYGQWEIHRLPDEDYKEYGYKNMKEYVEAEHLYYVHKEHDYSDKYRGVEYNIITLKRLNKEDRAKLVERYEERINQYKKNIPFYENVLKELKK